ncbi:MAG: hypothetical protein ACUVS1_11470 [Actinomycetota bacterium]
MIDELADRVGADAVIHAGHFGFFDDGSFERLSDRELRLHLAHADLPRIEKDRVLALSQNGMIRTARDHRLLGAFRSFLEGVESFHVPVYAAWGNHEDKDIVEQLLRGGVAVKHLHILHHRQGYRVGPAIIYGLGERGHGHGTYLRLPSQPGEGAFRGTHRCPDESEFHRQWITRSSLRSVQSAPGWPARGRPESA